MSRAFRASDQDPFISLCKAPRPQGGGGCGYIGKVVCILHPHPCAPMPGRKNKPTRLNPVCQRVYSLRAKINSPSPTCQLPIYAPKPKTRLINYKAARRHCVSLTVTALRKGKSQEWRVRSKTTIRKVRKGDLALKMWKLTSNTIII